MKFKDVIVKDGKRFSDWEKPVMVNYHMQCCDCGLVHDVTFRVVKITKRFKDGRVEAETTKRGEYEVQLKAARNNKMTKEQRKLRGITLEH